MFESALGRGPRMHLDSLTDIPERNEEKRDFDMYIRSLLTSIIMNMVYATTIAKDSMSMELVECRTFGGTKATVVQLRSDLLMRDKKS